MLTTATSEACKLVFGLVLAIGKPHKPHLAGAFDGNDDDDVDDFIYILGVRRMNEACKNMTNKIAKIYIYVRMYIFLYGKMCWLHLSQMQLHLVGFN